MLTPTEVRVLLVEAARRGPKRAKTRARELRDFAREDRDPARTVPVTGHIGGVEMPHRWGRS